MAGENEQLEIVFEDATDEPAVEVKETPEPEERGDDGRESELSSQLSEALQTNAALASRVSELTELLGATRSEAGIAKAIREAVTENRQEPLSEKEEAVKAVILKMFPKLKDDSDPGKGIATVATVLKDHMDSVRAERSAAAADLTEDLMSAAGMDATNPATVQFVEQGVVAQISSDPKLKQLYQSGRVAKAVREGFKKFSDTLPQLAGRKTGTERVAEKVAAVQRPNAGPRAIGSGSRSSAMPSVEPRTVKIDLSKVNTHQGKMAAHDAAFQLLTSLLGDDKE